jgi:hypothetical protein
MHYPQTSRRIRDGTSLALRPDPSMLLRACLELLCSNFFNSTIPIPLWDNFTLKSVDIFGFGMDSD